MSLQRHSSLVAFMEHHALGELDTIRKEEPDIYELIAEDTLDNAPPREAPIAGGMTPRRRRGLLRLTRAFADEATQKATTALAVIDRRLQVCHRAKSIGGYVSAIGGAASALLTSLGFQKPVLAIATAVVSSIGGVLTVMATSLERTPDGQRMSAADYQQFANHRAELAEILRRLTADPVYPLTDDELTKLYDRCAQIATGIDRLIPIDRDRSGGA